MGSGDWFKTLISLKKGKDKKPKDVQGSPAPEKSDEPKGRIHSFKVSSSAGNGTIVGISEVSGVPIEDIAATRIQTAYRAYKARKALRRLRGIVRLQILTQGHSVKKQASTTLNYLNSWNRIQSQIRARRICMVTEGRIKQKKLENQLKLEAKLHDVEVEWCSGSETLDEILARIHQREEAAIKRERAMAYAFTHQWKANSGQNQGVNNSELGQANWGWSWMERWITARPWESRVITKNNTPKKVPNKQSSKVGNNTNSPTTKISVSAKPASRGKGTAKTRRYSYPAAEKPAVKKDNIDGEKVSVKKELLP
ncbi:hypothetical protein RJ641_002271 [Dillenia turbinata]|uniref:Protein IQ-DOMAIN 1 n=1 Tax=Dillenia turbinata TaxID=194707 RepID=A0AAN8VNB1_9MAGN